MRPGQHNKRGRSRNRRHSGGGSSGGGGGGGNPLSRVYESNGPDVKVRGTAQTVAEKYLQLGRDAQSSGDIIMAESYYQYAEHYQRIVAAAQAYQQQMQPQYRRPGEEFDDEMEDERGEGETEEADGQAQPPPGASEQPDAQPSPDQESDRQQNFRPREQHGGRDRFRPRWQDRRDRPQQNEQSRPDEQPREAQPAGNGETAPARDWEAPSFLRRPMTVAGAEQGNDRGRQRFERRPRAEGEAPSEPAVPETPQPAD